MDFVCLNTRLVINSIFIGLSISFHKYFEIVQVPIYQDFEMTAARSIVLSVLSLESLHQLK